jgi:hypothetical protein
MNELEKNLVLQKIREIKDIVENSNIELTKQYCITDYMMKILSNCEVSH